MRVVAALWRSLAALLVLALFFASSALAQPPVPPQRAALLDGYAGELRKI